ncbi:GlxA family transcriptional regulator [Crenobacter caeni]|uniref:Helix-turn-helix domain-containing protein n=1 Tax=Crenobacter caeni TaxID=2705474 RepID=A0A6B2KR16_9NEIS|nr:helix-turn-helix domain-containing protein [Crenobacter caeni]NDV12685.1 helix-turn-helix domain-containing protein [Crenobacter caeni]
MDSAHPGGRWHVLLLPGFFDGEAGVLVDLLCAHAGAALPSLLWVSADGAPVRSAAGRSSAVDTALCAADAPATLFVLGGERVPAQDDAPLLGTLAALAQAGTRLMAVHGGVFWLAAAGLAAPAVAVHWTQADAFRERYPAVKVSEQLFELGPRGGSCAGGAALADFVLSLLAADGHAPACGPLAERWLLERVRRGDERQRAALRTQSGAADPKLVGAVELMQSNLEEPLTTDEIARLVHISRRQLERLFRQYLERVPSQYYLELRLERSRQLLRQTSTSIIQVGLSCGFSSGPHFSSAYRNHFGLTPRDERRQARGG